MAADLHVYIGSYTSNGGEGITLFALDPETGALKRLRNLAGVVNPSFLALAPDGRFLYAVNEVEAYYGKPEGALSAFAIEPGTGNLRFLNQRPSGGRAPCHLSLDHSGSFLFTANYGGGNVAVFPLNPDGSMGACTSLMQHQGSGPDRVRQQGPHAHCVLPDPFNRHVLAVDLGADAVFSYAWDPDRGLLRPAGDPAGKAPPGSGPRHLVFHPNGKWAYVVHELEARISRYAYHGTTGSLSDPRPVSSLPAGYAGENYPSGIQIDPRGRFLYASNRGQDGISHFRIDGKDGTLEYAGCRSSNGKFPRHFAIEPGGRFLLAANQRSDSVTVFRIDAATGGLEDTGHMASVPAPACVLAHAGAPR